jgi:LuxR family maltose regulon positive regulatory protein
MLKAAVLSDMGREGEAMVSITHSLELSMRGGYFMMYCAADDCIYDLILKVAARQKGSSMIKAHAKRIIDTLGKHSSKDNSAPVQSLETGGYWSLTERELEIMHLLNQGLTRTEIAKSQSVSQNTVKTHLKNIYSKLGVHSRSEVLRIAKENEQ